LHVSSGWRPITVKSSHQFRDSVRDTDTQ
jgi:hypothetical protein